MKSIRIVVIFFLFCGLASEGFGGEVKVLVNHIGYSPQAAKRAVIQGEPGDEMRGFKVVDARSKEVAFSGTPVAVGPVRKWKSWHYWTIDFTPLEKEGTYIIECASAAGTFKSCPFRIEKYVLERNTLSDVLYYFKGQRSSGLLDKADRSMRLEGLDRTPIDVHGGWFDATGDYGKHLSHLSFSTFFNPQQIPLAAWSLLATWRELGRRNEPYFRQFLRRLLDEGLFGADFLVRDKDPAGSFYLSISGRGPEKKPEDRVISPKATRHIILTPETKDKVRDYGRAEVLSQASYEAGFREGGGVAIAALALASTLGVSGDFGAAEYLKAAEDAFGYLEKNNLGFANDGRENIVDDYCALLAAAELFRATKASKYREAAERRARSLMDRLTTRGEYVDYWRADDGDRPFFHAADAGFPVVSLLNYYEIAEGPTRARILETIKGSFLFELWVTRKVANPFGYSRQLVQGKKQGRRTSFFFPHDTETAPWWQGENARLGSMAAASRLAARYFGEDRRFQAELESFGQDQLNWILGLNPYDSCMLYGRGRNNPEYMFFDSYEYKNAPGGISNGITAGYIDEEDIDYNLHFAETGKDDDWRWTEQWLPHAAWYLYAISIS